MSIREGPQELTLRTEEVRSKKSLTNVDQIAQDRWRPHLDAFCQAGFEGRDWEELYDHFKEKSRAAVVKKPNENQKAKVLWKMKAAKDRGEKFYDPERKDNIFGKK